MRFITRRQASAAFSSPLRPAVFSVPASKPWRAGVAPAALAWLQEGACAVPDAGSPAAFAAAGPVLDAQLLGEWPPDGYSVPPPADGLAPDDSSLADSRVVEPEAEPAENDSAVSSPDDYLVDSLPADSAAPVLAPSAPRQVRDSAELERLPRDVHPPQADFLAGSWVDSQAAKAGRAAQHSREPDGLHSVSPVSPEAPPLPSAAPPRWLPDAASALRFSQAAVRDALRGPAAVLQKAPGAEVASSLQRLAGSRRPLEAPPRDPQWQPSSLERSRGLELRPRVHSAAQPQSAARLLAPVH
jgi:hypothetical protein